VSRLRDEDQQLGSTAADRHHRVPDSTIPAVLSPTNRAGQLWTMWQYHLDRWIDFLAICFSMLVHVAVAEIHI
jgi:hypothetical protein